MKWDVDVGKIDSSVGSLPAHQFPAEIADGSLMAAIVMSECDFQKDWKA